MYTGTPAQAPKHVNLYLEVQLGAISRSSGIVF